jgi:tripartite-type tricarboxylate transporter receptor subunit TctC
MKWALAFLCFALSPSSAQQFRSSLSVSSRYSRRRLTDIVGRLVARKMQEVRRQTVIVENKPAPAPYGTPTRWRSAADGYTLGVVVTAHGSIPACAQAFSSTTRSRTWWR